MSENININKKRKVSELTISIPEVHGELQAEFEENRQDLLHSEDRAKTAIKDASLWRLETFDVKIFYIVIEDSCS